MATLPRPFHNLVSRWHARIPNEQLLLAESSEGRQPVFQAIASTPDGTHLFIVRMGGDRHLEAALELLDILRESLAGPGGPDNDIKTLAAAFCFDADTPSHWHPPPAVAPPADDCVARRTAWFSATVGPALGVAGFTHGGWRVIPAGAPGPGGATRAPAAVGLWIFHDPTTRQGTLESLLEPAMAADPAVQLRLEAAEAYLASVPAPLAPAADSAWRSEAGRAKARLTIAGQLERPGASLAGLVKRGGTPWMPNEVFQTPPAVALARFLTGSPPS